ncbi:hypothetical protein GCM10028805_49730 [Spirosoma harenae]
MSLSLPIPALARSRVTKLAQPIKLGLITDLHHDIMHDAPSRLDAFLSHSKTAKVDGIFQLGDFAFPNKKNKPIIDHFNRAHETRIHVIGNHDMDSGHTKQQCIDTWGMPGRYYTRKIKGVWFIVLDGNDTGSPTHKGGYPAYINPEQTAWLKSKLQELDGPIIILSHQPLMGALSVDNAADIQDLLANAADKVVLAINGHSHVDSLLYEKGIPYLTINSASYFWIGDKFAHESYSAAIHQAHPSMSRTCPYKDSLFSIMTIDPTSLTIQISGKQSSWVGKSPTELGFTDEYKPLRVDQEITPAIRARTIKP